MRKILLILILFATTIANVGYASSPKREMRSGWLATVWSIDWPSYKVRYTGDDGMIQRQKDQMISILDKMKNANANAVYFQVRSRCDAMYKSSFEPWSSDLVAERGLDPGYDPLQFVIEEAHKRGMEVHPWLNPYRYESVAGQWTGDGDYGKTNPDWLLQVGDAVILNPGLPVVRQRISDIVAEIVENYDVDGIIFDDYFYLQGIAAQDAATAAEYNTTGLSIGDWRRGNVNQMISDVYHRIKSIKPYVQFGVSPAGIWDGGATVAAQYGVKLPTGVSSGGYQYSGIYCDPLAWMRDKTIDYISPQIYWATTHSTAPYGPLSEWWSYVANYFGVQFYSSHSLSGVTGIPTLSTSAETSSISEDEYGSMSQLERNILDQSGSISTRATNVVASDYLLQVRNNRQYDLNGAPGSVFYSVKSLITTNLPEYLKANVFQSPSLRPALWSTGGQEEFVSNVSVSGTTLNWDYSGENGRFVIYAIPNAELANIGNFAKSDYLLGVVYSTKSYTIPTDKPASSYTYAVAVFDRFNNEYSPKLVGNDVVKTGTPVTLDYPANNSGVVIPDDFKWHSAADAEFYIFEIAADLTFSDILYRREVTSPIMAGSNLLMLRPGIDYYWRVTTRRVSTHDAVSAVYKFTTTQFSILSPTEGQETNSTPTIEWANIGGATGYKVEISNNKLNFGAGIVFTKETTATSCVVDAQKLVYSQEYYVRVSVTLPTGTTTSEVVSFNTQEIIPPVPTILTPQNGDAVATTVNVTWSGSEYASQYQVALSPVATFPIRNTVTKYASAYTYDSMFDGLISSTYYLRVRAYYGVNTTDWSEVVQIVGGSSSLEEASISDLAYVYKNGSEAFVVIEPLDDRPISINVYSMSGAKIQTVVNNYIPAGGKEEFRIPSFSDMAQGAYIVKIGVGNEVVNKKMLK